MIETIVSEYLQQRVKEEGIYGSSGKTAGALCDH